MCDGTGDDFYGRTMTEDGVMVLADGTVLSRPDVVAALENAPSWSSYEMDEVRVVPIRTDRRRCATWAPVTATAMRPPSSGS